MKAVDEITLADFTNKEIEDEYFERFGQPEEKDLSDYSTDDLIEALEERGRYQSSEEPRDEILDLIAEAARTSPEARRAYILLVADWPGILSLEARQLIIAGRMGGVSA